MKKKITEINPSYNKKGFYFWLEPEIDDQINGHLYASDRKSRSEFVNEAIKRYCCELDSEENKSYLSKEISETVQACVYAAEKHLSAVLFKIAGEQAALNLIIADRLLGTISKEDIEEYRRDAYTAIRKHHGVLDFNSAIENAESVD